MTDFETLLATMKFTVLSTYTFAFTQYTGEHTRLLLIRTVVVKYSRMRRFLLQRV